MQVVNKQRQVLHDIIRTLTGQEREAEGIAQVGVHAKPQYAGFCGHFGK